MLLTEPLERLATFEPGGFPVLSLYLNTQPDQRGRDHFNAWLRKELPARARTYRTAAERQSLQQDIERIHRFLETDLKPSMNGAAIFASSGSSFFEAVQLGPPIDRHELHIGDRPYLYPLARLSNQYPHYAAVVLDTTRARIFVFAGGELLRADEVTSDKMRRSSGGGWAQARYQRHTENWHLLHVKETVDVLDRVVTTERIDKIVLSGDEVVLPLVREQLPRHLAERIIDIVRLDARSPEHEVLRETLEALRRHDARTDREKIDEAVGAFRAGGLGVIGVARTLDALRKGQVDELLISASPDRLELPSNPKELAESLAAPLPDEVLAAEDPKSAMADHLVRLAQQTGARITFLEDPSLLEEGGGVGGLLRFKI